METSDRRKLEPAETNRDSTARPDVAGAPACRCRGDLDGDGQVDGSDLGLLPAAWGGDDPLANLDLDGRVDAIDLGRLLMAQGICR